MKKVLASLLMAILSLSIIITSFSASASDNSLVVHDTVAVFSASSGAAWGAGAKNPTFSAGDKIFSLECENTGAYTTQFQCMLPIKKLKDVVTGGDKILFDIYPVFTTKNGTNKCYLKYAFGAGSPGAYSGDFDHEIKSGEVYTLSIDTSKISTDSWAVYFQFQNYGDSIKDDAVIMGTVPYLENSSIATTVSSPSTTTTKSGDSGVSGGEFNTNDLTFPETAASLNGGWGSGASNPTYSLNGKSFTLNAKATSSGYTNQFQCLINIKDFSTVLQASNKIAFDFYPTFKNQNGNDSCYLKYSFDQSNWSGDFANPLKSGQKYTLIVDASSVSNNAKFIAMQFQNYGNAISSDAVIIGSAPYVYEATSSDKPTSSSSTKPSGVSGGTFDPNNLSFKDTIVSMSKGWESACTLIVDISKKFCSFTPYETSTNYVSQFQGYLNFTKLSNLINSTTQIAFDVYPTFNNQSEYDKKCYLKYSFDQKSWSGDFENALKSGEKYTLVINSSDIPDNAKAIQLAFQNYGSQISTDANIIVSAPYAYGTTIPSSTTTTTTRPTQKDFPPYNPSKAYFKINDVNAISGNLVEVPILIGNNPGIFSAKLNIKYDTSLLKFNSIKAGNVFAQNEIYNGPLTTNILNIAFESSDLINNNSKNGTLAVLVFEVNANAKSSSTPITFVNYDESNYISCEAEKVPFTFGNGSINITEKQTNNNQTVLAAPSNVNIIQISNNKAVLSWDLVNGALGYEVFRKVDGNWASYKTFVNSNTSSFVDSNLKKGKIYCYKVRAFSQTATSNFSSEKSVTTYKLTKVTKLKVQTKKKKTTIKWKAVKNAKQYQVLLSTKKKKGYKIVKTVKKAKATIRVKTNKKYYVKIRALTKVGTSNQKVYGSYSSVKMFKTK